MKGQNEACLVAQELYKPISQSEVLIPFSSFAWAGILFLKLFLISSWTFVSELLFHHFENS